MAQQPEVQKCSDLANIEGATCFVWRHPGSGCIKNAWPLMWSMCLVGIIKHLSRKAGAIEPPSLSAALKLLSGL